MITVGSWNFAWFVINYEATAIDLKFNSKKFKTFLDHSLLQDGKDTVGGPFHLLMRDKYKIK